MDMQLNKPLRTQALGPKQSGAQESWEDIVPRPYFDPRIVVTRSANGDPVSYYGDDTWDFASHSLDKCTSQKLQFWRAKSDAINYALAAQISEQNKALLWVITDHGDVKTFHTLFAFNSLLRNCSSVAYEKSVDLFAWLSDIEEISILCDQMTGNELKSLSGVVKTLWRNRRILLDDSARMQRDKIVEKIRVAQDNIPEGKQTPLIPSTIYCAILAGLTEELDAIERDLEILLRAVSSTFGTIAKIKRTMPEASRQQIKYARGKALAETSEQMRALGWTEGPGKTLQTFIQGKIVLYQVHLMHTVVALSGMRVGEAKILPLEGVLDTYQHRGHIHHVIKGYTHKLNRGVKARTEWITSDQGHRAIKIAIRLGQAILLSYNQKPKKGQEALLFPSFGNPFKMLAPTSFTRAQKSLIESICPKVTIEDLDELNRLEMARGWDRVGIEVGKRWPLAMHQLRRSLSVYAHRSGMVSLPALKAQLQHITDEMRAYYADGWSRAINLVFEKGHFSHEWNAAKTESTYFGLTGALQVAFEEGDELFGIGAQRIAQIVLGRSREHTLALIKSGTIAYRETVLGGCASTEECTTMPLNPVNFDCVTSNCVNLVARRKRLDIVIRSQESVVMQLEKNQLGSVEQRLETEHLRRMLLARDRLIQAKFDSEVMV